MSEEEIVFQLLEEDRRQRLERIVEERNTNKRIDNTNARIEELRIDMKKG